MEEGDQRAYREGYWAYQTWSAEGGERPENPYWTGSIDGEPREYHDWQRGWDDASFDD